jgi:hypothetical protein
VKTSPREPRARRSPAAVLLSGSLILITAVVAIAAFGGGSAVAQTQVAPSNTAEPTTSGNPKVGSTLTGTDGTWSNSPTSFVRQWLRCPSGGGAFDGSDCAAVSGATTSGYVLGAADVGFTMRFRVTATNADGSASAASNATAVVTAAAKPVNTVAPAVSGSPVQGQTLSGTNGTWTGTSPITYAHQWMRCPADGGASDASNCTAISGATSSTYTLKSTEVGSRVRFRVTATNVDGSQSAASNATATVTSIVVTAPANTVQPAISGNARQGSQLVVGVGSWTSPTSVVYTIAWLRCGSSGGNADASDCPAIPGATSTAYVAQSADIGNRLRVRVTATNASGSTVATTAATSTVQASGGTLPSTVVPITAVSLPARLVIDRVQFTPNPVRSRSSAIELRVHVADTRGNGVSGALVFARTTPILTTTPSEQATGADGWVTLAFVPRADFPLGGGRNVQVFIRARKGGEPILAGVSTRRLVQVRTAA